MYSWRRLANPTTDSPMTSVLTHRVAMRNAKAILSGKASLIVWLGVHALDNHTLQVIFRRICTLFLQILDSIALTPLPVKVIEKQGER